MADKQNRDDYLPINEQLYRNPIKKQQRSNEAVIVDHE